MTQFRPLYPEFQAAEGALADPTVLVNQSVDPDGGYHEHEVELKHVDGGVRAHLERLSSEYITPDEAARLLGVSRMTVYRRLKSGVLLGTKIGRRTLVHAPSLRAQMEPRDLSEEKEPEQ